MYEYFTVQANSFLLGFYLANQSHCCFDHFYRRQSRSCAYETMNSKYEAHLCFLNIAEFLRVKILSTCCFQPIFETVPFSYFTNKLLLFFYFLDMVHLADSVAVIFKDMAPLAETDVQDMSCWCLRYGLLMLFCLKPGPTC